MLTGCASEHMAPSMPNSNDKIEISEGEGGPASSSSESTSYQGFVDGGDDISKKFLRDCNEYYMEVSASLRTRFEDEGGSITVVKNLVSSDGTALLACFDVETNSIQVNYSAEAQSSVIHEMGHYLDKISGWTSGTAEFETCWREEVGELRSFHNTHQDNIATAKEFFAECFKLYIASAEELLDHCPKTYSYIESCVLNASYLASEDVSTKIPDIQYQQMN